jgi:hypothetical protein
MRSSLSSQLCRLVLATIVGWALGLGQPGGFEPRPNCIRMHSSYSKLRLLVVGPLESRAIEHNCILLRCLELRSLDFREALLLVEPSRLWVLFLLFNLCHRGER